MRAEVAIDGLDDVALGAAGVGDDGTRLEMWRDGGGDGIHLADRHRQQHELGAGEGIGPAGGSLVDDAQLAGRGEGLGAPADADHPLDQPRLAQGQREGASDQPDAIFVIDVGFHKIAISEAKKLGIPLIGVVDSNHNPEGIDYVIPGNDDSAKAVALYARGIADAILEGRANAVDEVVKAVAAEGSDEFVEVQDSAA